MKYISLLLAVCLLIGCLGGCAPAEATHIAATTLPVYEFTQRLCRNTDICVTRLVTENVSCLHEYTLQVRQMQAIESARIVVISGGGLEDFLSDVLPAANHIIDASANIPLLHGEHSHDSHDHGNHSDHSAAEDPHFWLSPELAMTMCINICDSLTKQYPNYEAQFQENLQDLLSDLQDLQTYGETQLGSLSCRKLITFHDGFSYFAQAFDLEILEAVEEESGSEASAQELISLIDLVKTHHLPAIFTEISGSTAAAQIIAAETGVSLYTLDMAMSGESYFTAMYHNIDTLKEALG